MDYYFFQHGKFLDAPPAGILLRSSFSAGLVGRPPKHIPWAFLGQLEVRFWAVLSVVSSVGFQPEQIG